MTHTNLGAEPPTDERAKFEAWRQVGLKRYEDAHYLNGVTQYMWQAWQARAALMEPKPG